MFDEFQETTTAPEEETKAIVVPSVITRTHNRLGQTFLDTVTELLKGDFKIKKYGVEQDWRDNELIELEFDDKTRISIQLSRKIES